MSDCGLVWILINGLTGCFILLVSIYFRKNPPSKINSLYGYRTKRSMNSQQAWDAAQLHSARAMLWAGAVIAFSAPARMVFPCLPDSAEVILSLTFLLLAILLCFLSTERYLAKNFSSNPVDHSGHAHS